MMWNVGTGVIPGVERIVVVRAGGLGDLVYALPALCALRETYPSAELTLATSPWLATLVAGRPGPVDRVVTLPAVPGVTVKPGEPGDPRAANEACSALAAERPDLAVQLVGGGRYSNPFLRRLGARVTIGARAADAEALDRWIPYVFYQSEIARQLEVVALAGARTAALEPELAATTDDIAEARACLAAVPLGHDDGAPLVAICPGAGDERRCWSPESFSAVADALARAGGRVVVIGSDRERWLAERVAKGMDVPAANLAGMLSLPGLAGLLASTTLVVGNDSGAVHLAAAVGASTVGVYWIGNVITGGVLSRARHRRAISWRVHCPVCGIDCTKDRCDHQASFVADVPVSDVLEPARELLQPRP